MSSKVIVLTLLCLVNAGLIIAADALIKNVSHVSTNILTALKSAPMLWCYLLYFLQIVLTYWLFVAKAEFAIYTNLFVVFYAIMGVLVGRLLFQESINPIQYIGVALGVVAAIMMNKA